MRVSAPAQSYTAGFAVTLANGRVPAQPDQHLFQNSVIVNADSTINRRWPATALTNLTVNGYGDQSTARRWW